MSIECAALDIPTGNVKPILHEVLHALRRWLKDGITHSIDLRSLPLAPQDEAELFEALGKGEVTVILDVLGDSEIIETRFAGVWLITHSNETHSVNSRTIEITDVPTLLRSQPEDIEHGALQLEQLLEERH